MTFNLEKHKLLLLLILADLLFIAMHLVHTYTGHLTSGLYSLERDRGYGEFFQYVKELWIAVLFLLLAVRYRAMAYLGFSLLFVYLLLDDSYQLHERVGAYLADAFALQPAFGLRAVDFGELLVSGSAGAFFFLLIGAAYLRADRPTRSVSHWMLVMILALAFFGVVADMVHILVMDSPALNTLLATVEDGGEMIVMSVILWFSYRLNLAAETSPVFWGEASRVDVTAPQAAPSLYGRLKDT